MKTMYAAAICGVVLVQSAAAHAGVDVNLSIGVPPAVVAPPPPTVVYEPPPRTVLYEPAPQVEPVPVAAGPSFIYSPDLGFYVATGIPQDMVYIGSSYYLYRAGYWYRAPSYAGPWMVVTGRRIPPPLRHFRYEQIRDYRDYEYRHFLHDREHYRGRWHRPGEERRERFGHERRWEHERRW